MSDLNRVTLTGNLTRDPQKRVTPSGVSALEFGVAFNEEVRDKETGGYVDRANFIDCVMFGARGDALAEYLRKGTSVAIEARLRWSSWEAKDGTRRSKHTLVVDEIRFWNRELREPEVDAPMPTLELDELVREQALAAEERDLFSEDIEF